MKNNETVASRDLETNNNDDEVVSNEFAMAKRRIYNPVTGKYYEIRERTSKTGRRGQIKGSWSSIRGKDYGRIWKYDC
jgi:hypothetical protein